MQVVVVQQAWVFAEHWEDSGLADCILVRGSSSGGSNKSVGKRSCLSEVMQI